MCLYWKRDDKDIVFLGVYVDDLLVLVLEWVDKILRKPRNFFF